MLETIEQLAGARHEQDGAGLAVFPLVRVYLGRVEVAQVQAESSARV